VLIWVCCAIFHLLVLLQCIIESILLNFSDEDRAKYNDRGKECEKVFIIIIVFGFPNKNSSELLAEFERRMMLAAEQDS
jgi:hypothetical protein